MHMREATRGLSPVPCCQRLAGGNHRARSRRRARIYPRGSGASPLGPLRRTRTRIRTPREARQSTTDGSRERMGSRRSAGPTSSSRRRAPCGASSLHAGGSSLVYGAPTARLAAVVPSAPRITSMTGPLTSVDPARQSHLTTWMISDSIWSLARTENSRSSASTGWTRYHLMPASERPASVVACRSRRWSGRSASLFFLSLSVGPDSLRSTFGEREPESDRQLEAGVVLVRAEGQGPLLVRARGVALRPALTASPTPPSIKTCIAHPGPHPRRWRSTRSSSWE